MLLRNFTKLLDKIIPISKPKETSSGESVSKTGPFTKFVIVGPDGTPYLTRWYLVEKSWFKIYLHKIHRSDADREMHCHPWKFVSFLLWGKGYFEHEANGSRTYFPPFSINVRLDAARPHRLEIQDGDPPQWSLVFIGKKIRDWGFHVPSSYAHNFTGDKPASKYVNGAVFVDHKSFLNVKFGKDNWIEEPFYQSVTNER